VTAPASLPLEGVTLRPRQPEDRDFLRALYASTRADELAPVPWTDEQKTAFLAWQFDCQTQHYDAHYPGCEFFVVEREGEPIGRLSLHRRATEVRIVDIALVAAWRGRGLGAALLGRVMDEAAAAGLAVTIHVEVHNPARRLYERLGFRETEQAGVYALLEWRP
jgi:RimJ/RimL family protein N-acetyltransferase